MYSSQDRRSRHSHSRSAGALCGGAYSALRPLVSVTIKPRPRRLHRDGGFAALTSRKFPSRPSSTAANVGSAAAYCGKAKGCSGSRPADRSSPMGGRSQPELQTFNYLARIESLPEGPRSRAGADKFWNFERAALAAGRWPYHPPTLIGAPRFRGYASSARRRCRSCSRGPESARVAASNSADRWLLCSACSPRYRSIVRPV